MKPSRIIKAALLGSRGVPANYGAFEICADRIATIGGKKNVRWNIYCPAERDCPATYGRANTIPIQHGKSIIAPLIYDIRSLWHASKSDVDVIVMLGYGAGIFLAIPRLFGKKLITNTDGFEYRRKKWPWWVRIYFQFCELFVAYLSDALISDSVHVVRYYKKRYGRNSTFIAYGTDVPDFSKEKRLQEELTRFLSQWGLKSRGYHVVVMRLEPENSIKEICEAAMMRNKGKPILVIGPTTRFFEKIVKPMISGSFKVITAGPIYNRSLLFMVRRHALSYIHGHKVGGINPTLLESLSTGTPVIAQDTLFNKEVLEEAGKYFNDTVSLISQLNWIETCSVKEWEQAVKLVESKLRDCFSWEKVVDDYEVLVRKVYLENE